MRANDPQMLLSADDGANQTKGDKGPEAWKPPNRDYWCEYARRWIWIKSDWISRHLVPELRGTGAAI